MELQRCDWEGELEILKRKRDRKEISGYVYDRSCERIMIQMVNQERRSLRRKKEVVPIDVIYSDDDLSVKEEESFIDNRNPDEYTVDTSYESGCDDGNSFSSSSEEHEKPDSIEDSTAEEPIIPKKRLKRGELVFHV